jgi:hypothetical protein
MVEIHKLRFQVQMGCCLDRWLPYGQVINHPNFPSGRYVYTSSPVEFNQEAMTFKTASGREYKIGSCLCEEKLVKDMSEAVKENQLV